MGDQSREAIRSAEELEFLSQYNPEEFARPSLAVDVVILTVEGRELKAVLVQRKEFPDKEKWSLPGGFVGMDESLEDAAKRLLLGKTGLSDVFLEQLYTFGEPGRDPRMRIITVAYMALVPVQRLQGLAEHAVLATVEVPWKGESGGLVDALWKDESLPMAFDHGAILGTSVLRIRGKLGYTHIGFELLPELFTLRQLRGIHEVILGRNLNKDSFRRKVLASGLLEATGKRQSEVGHRPAELYRFRRELSET